MLSTALAELYLAAGCTPATLAVSRWVLRHQASILHRPVPAPHHSPRPPPSACSSRAHRLLGMQLAAPEAAPRACPWGTRVCVRHATLPTPSEHPGHTGPRGAGHDDRARGR